jgi:hypothetical protein
MNNRKRVWDTAGLGARIGRMGKASHRGHGGHRGGWDCQAKLLGHHTGLSARIRAMGTC